MLTVSEALGSILAQAAPLPPVEAALLQSLGHVLAQDVIADIDNPPFDNSAVDGFAVRAEDTAGASEDSPVTLNLLGEVPAGAWPTVELSAGGCIKVFTGAPIPPGADAMVMVEDTRMAGNQVEVLLGASPGDHVRRAGEDIKTGSTVLSARAIIGSAEAAILAAMGMATVQVIPKPRVAVITTGDEVVPISEKPGPGRLRNSNLYALAALVSESGAELHSMRHIPDDPAATESAMRACAGLDGSAPADVIVTSGGVSVGERDFVKPALEKLGSLDLWRVKMKPGKPLAVGLIGETLFFGLPGNPVSTMVTFEVFVRPALWKMAGRSALMRPRVNATLTAPVRHVPGREEYVRAEVSIVNDRFVAAPAGRQGSGILRSMLGANALLVIDSERGSLETGDTAPALLLAPPTEHPTSASQGAA